MDAPPGWNANVAHGMTARHSRLETKPSRQLHLPVKQSPSAYRQNSAQNVKRRNSNLLPSIEQGVPAKGRSSDQASRARNSSRSIPVEKGKEKDTVKDNEVSAMYRKPWPPLWMSIAAAEQEETDEGELKMPKMPQILAAQRSAMGNDIYLEDIKQERKQWARSRQKIEKLAEERLKRADIEKMERFHLNISTLRGIPFQRQFNHQYAIMQELTSRSRRERQKKVLYDCEITGWYRTLEEEEWEKLGETDEEVNARLEDIKQHFKLSPKRPIYVRAKMALMVMSMPATEICQICVQRALQYLLVEVLLMPPETLSQWLALRGLPMVLVNAFDNSDI